jgi:hypothetical protein
MLTNFERMGLEVAAAARAISERLGFIDRSSES